MANITSIKTLSENTSEVVMAFQLQYVDTGDEDAVKKVDVSTLAASSSNGATCTRVHITQVWYAISGMRVDLEWNASSNVKALILQHLLLLS